MATAALLQNKTATTREEQREKIKPGSVLEGFLR